MFSSLLATRFASLRIAMQFPAVSAMPWATPSTPLVTAPAPRAAALSSKGAAAALAFASVCVSTGRKGVPCHQKGPLKKSQQGPIQSDRKEFSSFMKKFKSKYGEGAVMEFDKSAMEVPSFSTGAFSLDLALGGGLPYGRLVEVFGPEQSGKTTLALSCCVSLQKTGRHKRVAFIDAEHALDVHYAKQMGLNMSSNYFFSTTPSTAEDALDKALECAKSGFFDLIVIDSVAALVPQEEDDKDMADNSMALRARLLSKFCRKVPPYLNETGTTLLCINQLRANINGYGLAEDTVGGKAIKYTASVRMEVRSPQSGKIGAYEKPTGIRSKVHVVKNKLAAPYRRAEYDLIFGKGICWCSSLVEAGIQHNLVEKKGAWYQYGEHREQGKEKMVKYFEANGEECKKLEMSIRSLADKEDGPSFGEKAEDEEEEEEEA